MCHRVAAFLLLALYLLSLTVVAQVSSGKETGDREFGWSLTIAATTRKIPSDVIGQPARRRKAEDDSEIRIDTDLVLSDILVQDKVGRPVVGLRPDDFDVTENGVPQKIDVFANGNSSIPRSIILVIDHSRSQWRYMDKSIDAAKVLVDSLRPVDRMAIVSDDVRLITDLTSDKEALRSGLESLREKSRRGEFGRSSQYSALMAALNERIERNGTRNLVIFQTDGDQYPILSFEHRTEKASFGFDDIVKTAKKKGCTVYSVFTGARLGELSDREKIKQTTFLIQDESNAKTVVPLRPGASKLSTNYILARAQRIIMDEAAVSEIARSTGGLAQSLDSPHQAKAVYGNILTDIERRYVIGYYPNYEARDGNRREIKITLRKPSGYSVIGGRSYVAN